MKKHQFIFLVAVFLVAFPGLSTAIDLGIKTSGSSAADTGAEDPQVEVTNLPIQVMKKVSNQIEEEINYVRVVGSDSYVLDVVKDTNLASNEDYESPYLDVRDWRDISIYVIPEQVFSDIQPQTIYKLDAFFSVQASSVTKFQKFGEEKKDTQMAAGQEFGSMRMAGEKDEATASFTKLSTGPTPNRILASRVFGPFLKIKLTNLTPDTKVKFKVVAYLSR